MKMKLKAVLITVLIMIGLTGCVDKNGEPIKNEKVWDTEKYIINGKVTDVEMYRDEIFGGVEYKEKEPPKEYWISIGRLNSENSYNSIWLQYASDSKLVYIVDFGRYNDERTLYLDVKGNTYVYNEKTGQIEINKDWKN